MTVLEKLPQVMPPLDPEVAVPLMEHLRDSDLRHGPSVGTIAQRAKLRNVQYRDANVKSCNFSDADLRGADFRGAALDGATFGGAQLDGAEFEGAYVQSYDFKKGEMPIQGVPDG